MEHEKADMIKTLRITSIIAVVLAAGFFTLPAFFGVRGEKGIEEFLNSPGAIENFNKARGEKSAKSQDQLSPLVEQAQAFALYLNPPKAEPKPPTSPRSGPASMPKPRAVSAKFKLIGTSYYALHPELSLALIDEPGKGLRWVRQSSKVDHLVVEQVKDGLIVVRDGQRTFEVVAERPKEESLVKGSSPDPKVTDFKALLPTAAQDHLGIRKDMPPELLAGEGEKLEDAIRELQAMRAELDPGAVDANETSALLDEFIAELESSRISAEEAERLGALGRELEDVRREPNGDQDRGTRTEPRPPVRRTRRRK